MPEKVQQPFFPDKRSGGVLKRVKLPSSIIIVNDCPIPGSQSFLAQQQDRTGQELWKPDFLRSAAQCCGAIKKGFDRCKRSDFRFVPSFVAPSVQRRKRYGCCGVVVAVRKTTVEGNAPDCLRPEGITERLVRARHFTLPCTIPVKSFPFSSPVGGCCCCCCLCPVALAYRVGERRHT